MLEFDIQELLTTQGGITILSAAIILFFVGLMIGQIKAALVKSKFNKLKRESFIPLRSSYEALQRDHLQLEEDADKYKKSSTEAKDELKLMKEALELYKLKAEEEKTKLKASLEAKIKDIDLNKNIQYSNKDKELALWAEKYNALNSELTSFKAHENQKILDLEQNNAKLQNELDQLNTHLSTDSSPNKGWKVKHDLLLEEFDQYKKNAEDNRQDWAHRYTLLQEEYQDFKVSVLKGTEKEDVALTEESSAEPAAVESVEEIAQESIEETTEEQNNIEAAEAVEVAEVTEVAEDTATETALSEEAPKEASELVEEAAETEAVEEVEEAAETDSEEAVTEEETSEDTSEETASTELPEVEASNITEEAVLWQQKYEALEKDFLTFKSQIEEKFEQSKKEEGERKIAQPDIEELKSLIKEVGQEMTTQKLSDTERAYLASYEVKKEETQTEETSEEARENQEENSADTIFKSHYFGTK
ncbi:MAG: hypothetical protein ACPGIE_00145 [Flavobacteriaceae bacterium]